MTCGLWSSFTQPVVPGVGRLSGLVRGCCTGQPCSAMIGERVRWFTRTAPRDVHRAARRAPCRALLVMLNTCQCYQRMCAHVPGCCCKLQHLVRNECDAVRTGRACAGRKRIEQGRRANRRMEESHDWH